MTSNNIEATKVLAVRFVESLNRRDIDVMAALLHHNFIWNTAVTADDAPNELRPTRSKTLQGRNLPHAKPRLNREESLAVFRGMFKGHYRDSMSGAAAGTHDAVIDEQHHMRLDILGLTAEDDRVAMEAQSHVLNPVNQRLYNNFYHYLFRVRNAQIVLFKEYQDTLHLFDFVSE